MRKQIFIIFIVILLELSSWNVYGDEIRDEKDLNLAESAGKTVVGTTGAGIGFKKGGAAGAGAKGAGAAAFGAKGFGKKGGLAAGMAAGAGFKKGGAAKGGGAIKKFGKTGFKKGAVKKLFGAGHEKKFAKIVYGHDKAFKFASVTGAGAAGGKMGGLAAKKDSLQKVGQQDSKEARKA
ncbi:hypothetical protein SSS_07459 [Sarcoptes scabiei]|nr:hypothetical protein SSS_07459 [Sarcoptes scabiei]